MNNPRLELHDYFSLEVEMSVFSRSLLLLLLLPTSLAAAGFEGRYKQALTSDCSKVGESGGALEIRNGIFYGVHNQCRMTRPVQVVNMEATLYTMQCSGDEDQWTERALLMKSYDVDGIIMVWDGYAFVYEKCSEIE